MTEFQPKPATLPERLSRQVDASSLAMFRVLFGVLMAGSLIRFMASDWINELYVRPTFFFKYSYFEWVQVWGPTGLHLHFTVLIIAAVCIAIGLFYRVALMIFLVGFTWIQLMDQTNYLNHYYLVILIATILLFVPANCALSVDARRNPHTARDTVPVWTVYLLRFQVALVYVFAAVAKLGTDWLIHAQPLSIWLSARSDMPLLGPLLGEPWMAYAMSWGGLVYDGTIVGFLLWSRSRPYAYAAVIGFHAMTWALFDIGIFPFIMAVFTTIFFAPDWPRRFIGPAQQVERPTRTTIRGWQVGLLTLWCAFHVTFPLRHLSYSGDVLWNEQGMRYAWKVMVREKMGSITYRVERLRDGREWQVSPSDYLEPRQLSEMSSQPDMIVQLAHHIRQDFITRGRGEVAVRVDALISLNGRPAHRMIDPKVDLTRLAQDLSTYILASPEHAPLDPWAKDG
jgi:vitamin K-dependent gamma-carboxylase